MSEKEKKSEFTPEQIEERNHRAEEIIKKRIGFLMLSAPFFGSVFMTLNIIRSDEIKTMAVGPVNKYDLAFYYNTDFTLSLTQYEVVAVLMHEAYHILLHHITRSREMNYEHKGFNIAADMAINTGIVGLPKNCYVPKTFNFPENQSADIYYKLLKNEAKKKNQSIEEFVAGKGFEPDDHSLWDDCGDEDIISEKIRQIAQKAIDAENSRDKSWGDIPGHLIQMIIEANKPKINWKKNVRYFINKVVQIGKLPTRIRVNRREQATKIDRQEFFKNVNFMTGKKKDYTSKLLVAADTSGSVSDSDLKDFLTEVLAMSKHVEVHFICFDTIIYGKPQLITKKDISKIKIQGRGGTNFSPIIEMIDKTGYDGLIIFTDGYAPFPPKPKARVLWALTKDSDVKPPYGKYVKIEAKK